MTIFHLHKQPVLCVQSVKHACNFSSLINPFGFSVYFCGLLDNKLSMNYLFYMKKFAVNAKHLGTRKYSKELQNAASVAECVTHIKGGDVLIFKIILNFSLPIILTGWVDPVPDLNHI